MKRTIAESLIRDLRNAGFKNVHLVLLAVAPYQMPEPAISCEGALMLTEQAAQNAIKTRIRLRNAGLAQ